MSQGCAASPPTRFAHAWAVKPDRVNFVGSKGQLIEQWIYHLDNKKVRFVNLLHSPGELKPRVIADYTIPSSSHEGRPRTRSLIRANHFLTVALGCNSAMTMHEILPSLRRPDHASVHSSKLTRRDARTCDLLNGFVVPKFLAGRASRRIFSIFWQPLGPLMT